MLLSFKDWLIQKESSARTRAAMDVGQVARPDLVFSKPPYSQKAYCNKLKRGDKVKNASKSVCKKKKKKK